MKIFITILATVALLLGAIWDNVSAPKYRAILTTTLISEIVAATGFFYLLKTSRGFLKYYGLVCVGLCLLIIADAIGRLLAQ